MREWLSRLRGETGLLLFFLLASTYMYGEARTFQQEAAQFPKLTAGVVIVGGVLLLLRPYLPAFMDELVSDEAEFGASTGTEDLSEVVDEEDPRIAETVSNESNGSSDTVDRRYPTIPSTVFTTVVISAYVLCGYLFGLLWATPPFVAVYMWWYRIDWQYILIVTAISTVVVYLFIVFLYAPFDSGLLFEPSGVLDIS